MDTADVIAFGAFLLSAVGAGIALWQAGIASRARADAQAANDAAADHEAAALRAAQDAASAATRSADEARRTADALEEANELARAQIPDDVVTLSESGNDKYIVHNVSKNTLFVFAILEVGGGGDVVFLSDDNPTDLSPREGVPFLISRSFASPPTTTIIASWGDPMTGERTEVPFTIF